MELGTIEIRESKDQGAEVVVNKVNGNVWMTPKMIAKLFDRSRVIVTEHIKNIFKEGELEKDKTTKKFPIVAQDGTKYETNYYNLNMIMAVGFRVKSPQGIMFRRWIKKQLLEALKNQPGQAESENKTNE